MAGVLNGENVTEDRWNSLGGKKVQSDGTHGRSNFLMAYMELQTFIMTYMKKTHLSLFFFA
jgi:hypothetical protein